MIDLPSASPGEQHDLGTNLSPQSEQPHMCVLQHARCTPVSGAGQF